MASLASLASPLPFRNSIRYQPESAGLSARSAQRDRDPGTRGKGKGRGNNNHSQLGSSSESALAAASASSTHTHGTQTAAQPALLINIRLLPSLLQTTNTKMQSWKALSASLPSVDLSAASKNFRNTVQATRYVYLSLMDSPLDMPCHDIPSPPSDEAFSRQGFLMTCGTLEV